MEPIKITSVLKTILDKSIEVTICCDLMQTNGIGFLNNISRHIMFATASMIKTEKLSALQMESYRYINYTCNAVSISHTCTLIVNLPILQEDFRMGEDIYGPSIPHLKVKIVRRKVQHVEPIKITSVLKTILDKYKEVTICCDLMHINGIGFLITISRHIMFATASMIKNRKVERIADGIIQVHKLYLQRGFNITHMHTGCEFEPLRKEMTALGINLTW